MCSFKTTIEERPFLLDQRVKAARIRNNLLFLTVLIQVYFSYYSTIIIMMYEKLYRYKKILKINNNQKQ